MLKKILVFVFLSVCVCVAMAMAEIMLLARNLAQIFKFYAKLTA